MLKMVRVDRLRWLTATPMISSLLRKKRCWMKASPKNRLVYEDSREGAANYTLGKCWCVTVLASCYWPSFPDWTAIKRSVPARTQRSL
ncbi:hypothetical protein BDW22DRAFT_274110 [Trametopsis cervina]|nr:hypothetical protein BDW22DRAFT_274110 [Trametopsis cervina]